MNVFNSDPLSDEDRKLGELIVKALRANGLKIVEESSIPDKIDESILHLIQDDDETDSDLDFDEDEDDYPSYTPEIPSTTPPFKD